MREEFPWLKSRLPSLWSRSYYIGSVGHVSEATIKKYIANQKTKVNAPSFQIQIVPDEKAD
ncbi:MAG: transposase [Blastocatellales bacterium]|nr:transposase [Blastocatellales bacterium]